MKLWLRPLPFALVAGYALSRAGRHTEALARHFRRKFAPLASRHPDLPTLFAYPRE